MKQKTVRLDGMDYAMRDGVVCAIKLTYPETDIEYAPTKYVLGQQAVLISKIDVSPNAIRSGDTSNDYFCLSFDLDGIGGNSNPNIKRYHGWRGTTCDKAIHAYGLREIINIRQLKNGDIAVTVGPDLKPDAP